MEDHELKKKIEILEFENEKILSELAQLDTLMHQVGFSKGLQSVKESARQIFIEKKK